jgi:hypothetical protein
VIKPGLIHFEKINYSDVQKSVPVKLARLLLDITIGCCFDSHPRIDSILQNSGFRYGLLENAIESLGERNLGLPNWCRRRQQVPMFRADKIKSAQEMPQSAKAIRDIACYLNMHLILSQEAGIALQP